ncbi:MAG: EthD domain-containing protein [Acidimicrobiales bacterium]|jgi:hypothetical protein
MSGIQTPGVKAIFLIKRRPAVSREELIAHWFSNHMPAVIAAQHKWRETGRAHASRYIATLYDADSSGDHVWDGAAQLWFEQAPPAPDVPHGTVPADSFQERAETYVPWSTKEHVFVGGDLAVEPLTLNAPFPTTRSGFFRVSMMAAITPGADSGAFHDYWLNVHAPAAAQVLEGVGAIRYSVSTSLDPAAQFAGMAELTLPNADAWKRYQQNRPTDDMDQWVDADGSLVLHSSTDMIGIP